MKKKRAANGRMGSRRFLTGMVLGIALGVQAAKMLGQIPRETWDRVLARTSGAEERTRTVRKVVDGDTIVLFTPADGG